MIVMLSGFGRSAYSRDIGFEVVEGDADGLFCCGIGTQAGCGHFAIACGDLRLKTVQTTMAAAACRHKVQYTGFWSALRNQLIAALLGYADKLFVQRLLASVAEMD